MASPIRIKGSRLIKAQTVASLGGAIADLGGNYIYGTALNTGDWCELLILTATVLDAATKCNITNITGVSLPAGTRLPGMFSQIKLTSGTLIAYKAGLNSGQ